MTATNPNTQLMLENADLRRQIETLRGELAEWQTAFAMFKGTPKELADWAVKDAAKLQELGRKSAFLQ